MTDQTVRVGLCGLGTVGQGVLALLNEGRAAITARSGTQLVVTHVGTRTPKPEVDTDGAKDSRDVFDVARDPDVDVLIDLVGGDTALADHGGFGVGADVRRRAPCGHQDPPACARDSVKPRPDEARDSTAKHSASA